MRRRLIFPFGPMSLFIMAMLFAQIDLEIARDGLLVLTLVAMYWLGWMDARD